MKKKKLIATVLSASMLVGLLAGCGSSTDPAESPTGGGETTPVVFPLTLRYHCGR